MRSQFCITYPGGDFVVFEAATPATVPVNYDGSADLALADIAIIERGNYLVGNAADELPQVSV